MRSFFAGLRVGIRRDPVIWLLLLGIAVSGLTTYGMLRAPDSQVRSQRLRWLASLRVERTASPSSTPAPVAAPPTPLPTPPAARTPTAPARPAPRRAAPEASASASDRPAPPVPSAATGSDTPSAPRPEAPSAPSAGSALDARAQASQLLGQGRACDAVRVLEPWAADPDTRQLYGYARESCRR